MVTPIIAELVELLYSHARVAIELVGGPYLEDKLKQLAAKKEQLLKEIKDACSKQEA